jgi:hypothetical protein
MKMKRELILPYLAFSPFVYASSTILHTVFHSALFSWWIHDFHLSIVQPGVMNFGDHDCDAAKTIDLGIFDTSDSSNY